MDVFIVINLVLGCVLGQFLSQGFVSHENLLIDEYLIVA